MVYIKDNLIMLLNEIGYASKSYVNLPKKSLDSGDYFKQIWTARSVGRIKARDELLIESNKIIVNNKETIGYLESKNILTYLELEEAENKELYLFLMPLGLELLKILEESTEEEINQDIFGEMLQNASETFNNIVLNESISRLQEPLLEVDSMSAKSAIFCWFLILTGAISKDSAMIIQKQENDGEIEFQKEIVEYLNEVSSSIFKKSHKSKTSKVFKEGDLSNFFRRNKEIKTAYSEFFKNDKELFYFDLVSQEGETDSIGLSRVVQTTIKRIIHFGILDDHVEETLINSIKWFYLNNPIKQAHMRSLFAGRPDYDYYSILGYAVREELENIELSN